MNIEKHLSQEGFMHKPAIFHKVEVLKDIFSEVFNLFSRDEKEDELDHFLNQKIKEDFQSHLHENVLHFPPTHLKIKQGKDENRDISAI
jgi:hypothetical protein